MTRPDRLSLKTRVRPGRGAPRAMPAPDGDANSHAAVSSSPGDTVSAPCRGSRPGPAALDRPPQSRGPAPARPGRYGRLDESSTGDSGGRPPWGRGCQAAAGRQATLTIGPNHAALSSQIDHTARRQAGGGGAGRRGGGGGPRPRRRGSIRSRSQMPAVALITFWSVVGINNRRLS